MESDDLTARVNPSSDEESDENLEKKVSIWEKIKSFMGIGITTYLATLFTGVGAVATVAGHYAADFLFKMKDYKKNFVERLAKSTHQANTAASLRRTYFGFVNMYDNPVWKALSLIAVIPPFSMIYLPIQYAIETYGLMGSLKNLIFHPIRTFREIYDNTYANGNVMATIKSAYKYLALPLYAIAMFVPKQFQVAVAALSSFGYKVADEYAKRRANDNPNPQILPFNQNPANQYLPSKDNPNPQILPFNQNPANQHLSPKDNPNSQYLSKVA